MEFNTRTRLSAMIEAIDEQLKIARSHGLAATASLLEMAKLEAQLHLHGITDIEFGELCDVLARRTKTDAGQGIVPRHAAVGEGRQTALARSRVVRRVRGGQPA